MTNEKSAAIHLMVWEELIEALATAAILAFSILLEPQVYSEALAESPPSSSARPAGPQDPAELAVFLDGLLGGLMAERHIPGAVALVVKDGTVFFAKGYGFADLETRRPVNPEATLFRVASVSKLFTATAVMQLVEQGKLDLHVDVNQYLESFSLKAGFGKPVTLANLLTHTGGFDDAFLGSAQPLEWEPIPLGKYLSIHMPPRVMPPGDLISYSNHGLALAGYLVERASGQPFAEYVKEHILQPLGMQRSGFGWYQSPLVHTIVSALCSLIFLGTVLGWTLGVIVRRVAGGPTSSVPRSARRLGFVVSFLDTGFLAGVSIALRTVSPWVLFEGVPVWLVALCTVPLVSIPLSLGLPYFLLRSFWGTDWTPLAQLHYLFLTLAAFLFAGWVWYWNLLGVGF